MECGQCGSARVYRVLLSFGGLDHLVGQWGLYVLCGGCMFHVGVVCLMPSVANKHNVYGSVGCMLTCTQHFAACAVTPHRGDFEFPAS